MTIVVGLAWAGACAEIPAPSAVAEKVTVEAGQLVRADGANPYRVARDAAVALIPTRAELERAIDTITASPTQDMRARIVTLRALNLKGMPSFNYLSTAPDAMEAPTFEEARRIAARLPISVTHEHVGTTSSGRGRYRTTIRLNGILKHQSVDGGGSSFEEEMGVVSPLPESEDGEPSEATSESLVPLAAPTMMYPCETDPNDPCATQEERDYYAVLLTALRSDLDSLEGAADAAFAPCIADSLCYYGYDQNAAGSALADLREGFATLESDAADPFSIGSPEWDCVVAESTSTLVQGCNGEIAAAAVATVAAGGVALLALGATLAPEPVSKFTVAGWWTLTLAAAGAAGAAIGHAMNCVNAQ